MEERFDDILANKLRSTLQEHTEAYEDGAWEHFLARKKKRKNRVFYWYFIGVASTVTVFLSLAIFLSKNGQEPAQKRIPVFQDTPTISDSDARVDSPLDTKEDVVPQNTIEIKKDSGILGHGSSVFHGTSELQALRTKKTGSSIHKVNIENAPSLVLAKVGLASGTLDSVSVASEEKEPEESLWAFNTIDEQFDTIPEKGRGIRFGFQFSPSYGSSSAQSQALASTNYGGGVTVNIPIKSSQFSIDTGVIYNSLDFTNERTSMGVAGAFIDVETTNEQDISLNTIDIPLNLTYAIPGKNENFYVQAGFSSYITFDEVIASTEASLFTVGNDRGTNGFADDEVVIELQQISETSESSTARLRPLGTLNFALGYKAPLSDGLQYEIQPFYKLPLNSLTTEDVKVPMAGVALRLILRK